MFSRTAVFALFYLSGIAGLIYQVLWLRRLSAIFGVAVYAASTVLAAFMAGLASARSRAGSCAAAFAARRIQHRESTIGATGLLSPALLDAAAALYIAAGIALESLGCRRLRAW